jgi:hypothetical protein
MFLRALHNQFHVDGGVKAVVVAYEVESRIDEIGVFINCSLVKALLGTLAAFKPSTYLRLVSSLVVPAALKYSAIEISQGAAP